MMWRADNADPEIRSVRPGRAAGGSDWIGLRRNEGYTVAGINQLPLLPGILVALDIVITRHGKPAGVLIGFASEDDWFDYRLENDPRFARRIGQARSSLRSGRRTRLEDLD
jgi:hypothetical protein